jgi:hypothetical protein
MSELSDNLVRVIDRWSELETGGFDSTLILSSLWNQSHLDTIPYDPDGIDDLIQTLKDDKFFKNHPKTELLDHGQFSEGGGIPDEGELFNFFEADS